ncbi:hypothetical protein GCM10009654_11730 [Streptomyces hebeiensis]|uniref:Transposase n=1 Tax=Streptomyces hebeiensis TaxID=229486 RepID=A0ABN1ULA7_9ACTN
MARPSSYPPELRKRAVRMVAEVCGDYPAESAAINAIMVKLGIGSRETLRKWVRQDQIDSGTLPGTTSGESAQIEPRRFDWRLDPFMKSISIRAGAVQYVLFRTLLTALG